MKTTLLICIAIFLVLVAGSCWTKCKKVNQSAKRSQIETLIEQLASPNQPPDVTDEPFVEYPENYNEKKQAKVDEAIEELMKMGRKAFPLLVAYRDDPRYSCTRVYAAARNWTVGNVCFLILYNQVENFDHFPKSWGSMPHGLWDIYHSGKLKEWWKKREKRTLQELQLEAIDHRIEGERTHEYKDKREHILKYLIDRREQILKGAIPPERYGI